MKKLNKNARGFVEGVISSMKKGGKSQAARVKVEQYLHQVSQQEERENIAHIETAVTLTDTEKRELAKTITDVIGRPLKPEYHVHPSLIGGIRIRIGELVLDTSLKTQLDDLRQSLL